MPRALDPLITRVLEAYGEDARKACWDCHGTWVVLHKALERVAARANIKFDPPSVIQADAEKKIVALCVTGTMDTRSEWSVGEAAPYNNKNAYPFAMAEKRAKDRVILKLVGLHGVAYSEDEADKFVEDPEKPTDAAPEEDPMTRKNPPGRSAVKKEVEDHVKEFNACCDGTTLIAYVNQGSFKKFAVRVCGDYPNDWLGPEDNSGLSGCLAQRSAQLGVEAEIQNYIKRVEQAARDAKVKHAAE